ncbi:MAG: 5-(carboxyamino)imidazole ribonucleotide mutase [Candidatus Omnitrophica bacterium]|nr:5-(carboxyamino)imidazole ribonucleotide mutase [Candidatus Omnitrophota bacterium]
MKKIKKPLVGIIMGSQSDLAIMSGAADVLDAFVIPYELTVVSAHRSPKRMFDYAQKAEGRGLKVIIAGAGGAAHAPGMVASLTTLPVVGVPIKSGNSLEGLDSLLSIVQMPDGIPVATVAVNGARNAGVLAAEIIGTFDASVARRLKIHKVALKKKVETSAAAIKEKGFRNMLKPTRGR